MSATESSILGLRVLLQSDFKLQRPRLLVRVLGEKRNNYDPVQICMNYPLLSYLLPEELCLLPSKVIGVSTFCRPKSSSEAKGVGAFEITTRDHRWCTGGYRRCRNPWRPQPYRQRIPLLRTGLPIEIKSKKASVLIQPSCPYVGLTQIRAQENVQLKQISRSSERDISLRERN